MSLDRAFRATFRNFSTLFLLVASLTVPLHLAYSVAFRDVVAVGDLRSAIERFPPHRKVHGVGRKRLHESRVAFIGLSLLEVALIPVLVRATERVLEVDEQGGVPSVLDAYRHVVQPRPRQGIGFARVVAAVVVAITVAFLAERIGLLLTEPVPRTLDFLAAGLVRALSRAVGAPFALSAMALESLRREARQRPGTP
jgi:hypothetical protein